MGTALRIERRVSLEDSGSVTVAKYRESLNIWLVANDGPQNDSTLCLTPREARKIAKALKAAAKAVES